MRRFTSSALASALLLVGNIPANAEWDHWAIKALGPFNASGFGIYTVDSSDGSATLRTTKCFVDPGINECEQTVGTNSYIDPTNGKLKLINASGELHSYDLDANNWTNEGTAWSSDYTTKFKRPSVVGSSDGSIKIEMGGSKVYEKKSDGSVQIGADGNDIDVVEDGLNIDGAAVLTKNADGSIQIGTDENDIDITSEGLSIDGDPLISKKANGELHIGKNSWITKEENGVQKVYAKDAAGNPIPIDYTNGTKLLINGRDVDQAIDNVGALSAALTGLPTVPQDSPLACGVGAGAHSGSNALSGGCASKINERLTFNAAASFIPANQEYQGTDNSWSGRAGFVFKLGKINKPTLISMRDKKEMQSKITELSASNTEIKAANEKIQSQNKELQTKVDSFELEKAALVARLEKIEQIALANQKDEKTAFSFLNVSNLFSSMRSFLISSN